MAKFDNVVKVVESLLDMDDDTANEAAELIADLVRLNVEREEDSDENFDAIDDTLGLALVEIDAIFEARD